MFAGITRGKRFRSAAIALVSAAALTLLTACGGSADSGSSSGDEGSGEKLTIGSVIPTLENPFWQRYVTFQEEAAEQLGFELLVVDGQGDGSKMLNAAQDLIARGVDGLIHVGYYDTGRSVIKAAQSAGIPVAIADSSPEGIEPQSDGYENYIAFMGPNDAQAGQLQAEILVDTVREAGNSQVELFGLEGTLGTSVNEGRVEGLNAAVEGQSDVNLVGTQTADFLREDALNVVTNVLQSNSDVNAIWTANDDMAMGAIQAISRAGLTPGEDVFVSGMDLNGDALDAVKSGEMVVSLGGHWLQGGFLAAVMFDHLNGHEVPKDKSVIKLDLPAVDQGNVEAFETQFPDGQPADYDFKEVSPVFNESAPVVGYEIPPIG